MERENNGAIIIVPVRMDGKYAKMLLNIRGQSAINALMEFYRARTVKYSILLDKYADTISDMQHTTHELPPPQNGIYWIAAAYIPELLDEMNESVQFSYRYYNYGVVDYVGSILYIIKNEKHPEGQIAYFTNTPPKGDSVYILNIDNQMEEDRLGQLNYLKNVFGSEEDPKIVNISCLYL